MASHPNAGLGLIFRENVEQLLRLPLPQGIHSCGNMAFPRKGRTWSQQKQFSASPSMSPTQSGTNQVFFPQLALLIESKELLAASVGIVLLFLLLYWLCLKAKQEGYMKVQVLSGNDLEVEADFES